MLSLLLTVACLGPVSETWTIDRPLAEIAICLRDHVSSPAAHIPPGLLTAQGAEDVGRMVPRIQLDYHPADHYLWTRADLRIGRISGHTILEAWGIGGATTCRLTTELTMPHDGPIARIVCGIGQRAAVRWEREQLRQLTEVNP